MSYIVFLVAVTAILLNIHHTTKESENEEE